MSPQDYLILDSVLLVVLALNCWVLGSEDPIFQPLIPRAVIAVTGLVLFSHVLWMSSEWLPSAAGVPFWRLMGDACFVGLSSTRLFQVFRAKSRERRRIAGLAAMRNPNLDVTVKFGRH